MQLCKAIIFGLVTGSALVMGAKKRSFPKKQTFKLDYTTLTYVCGSAILHQEPDGKKTSLKMTKDGLFFEGFGEKIGFKWDDLLTKQVEETGMGNKQFILRGYGITIQGTCMQCAKITFRLKTTKSGFFSSSSIAEEFEKYYPLFRGEEEHEIKPDQFDVLLNKKLANKTESGTLKTHTPTRTKRLLKAAKLKNQAGLKYNVTNVVLCSLNMKHVESFSKAQIIVHYEQKRLELQTGPNVKSSFDMKRMRFSGDCVPDHRHRVSFALELLEHNAKMGTMIPHVLKFKTTTWRELYQFIDECTTSKHQLTDVPLEMFNEQFAEFEAKIVDANLTEDLEDSNDALAILAGIGGDDEEKVPGRGVPTDDSEKEGEESPPVTDEKEDYMEDLPVGEPSIVTEPSLQSEDGEGVGAVVEFDEQSNVSDNGMPGRILGNTVGPADDMPGICHPVPNLEMSGGMPGTILTNPNHVAAARQGATLAGGLPPPRQGRY